MARRPADSGGRSSDKEDATLLEELHLMFGQSHLFSGTANLRKSQFMSQGH